MVAIYELLTEVPDTLNPCPLLEHLLSQTKVFGRQTEANDILTSLKIWFFNNGIFKSFVYLIHVLRSNIPGHHF